MNAQRLPLDVPPPKRKFATLFDKHVALSLAAFSLCSAVDRGDWGEAKRMSRNLRAEFGSTCIGRGDGKVLAKGKRG
jgi:hypothetical protein